MRTKFLTKILKGIESKYSKFQIPAFLLIVACILPSCCPKVPMCRDLREYSTDSLYNVEFKVPVKSPCSGEYELAFRTYYVPVFFDKTDSIDYANCTRTIKKVISFYDASCAGCGNIVETNFDNLNRITNMSTGLDFPRVVQPDSGCFDDCDCNCTREKEVDELTWEIKAMVGFRPIAGTNDEKTIYPDINGTKLYDREVFGTGIGGSSIIAGGEFAVSKNFKFIDNWFSWLDSTTGAFKIGAMTGVWPMDGSVFIPLGAHLRWDINMNLNFCKYLKGLKCGSWYYFADLGPAFSLNQETNLLGYFGDIGAGYDYAWGKSMDFTIDFGLRFVHTPMPKINAPLECQQNLDLNPARNSGLFFLRCGLTF
jgi:hypothetical protein